MTFKMPEPSAYIHKDLVGASKITDCVSIMRPFGVPHEAVTMLFTTQAIRDVLEQAAQRLERITDTSPRSALALAGVHASADIIRVMIKEIPE